MKHSIWKAVLERKDYNNFLISFSQHYL